MKPKIKWGLVSLCLALSLMSVRVLAQEVRTIVFNEDRDQKYMCTKVFQLKNMRADDLTPFILGSVKRYNDQSDVQRLNYKYGKKQYIVVSTGVDMMPYVDDMVSKLDRPCSKKDVNGSIVDGDGIYRFVYYTKYRANAEMVDVLKEATGGDGITYFDPTVNMFYWKNSKSDGSTVLRYLKAIDRPVPQLNIGLKVYEINENDFIELGIDYVSWKNGPGASLLGAGFDWTDISSMSNVSDYSNMMDIVTNVSGTGLGGFMVAPNFDATFLRLLNQKGKARVATSGQLVVVNDFDADPGNDNFDDAKFRLKFSPTYQTIMKNDDQEISVEDQSDEDFWFYLRSPTIGFNDSATAGATVMFGWVLDIEDMVEKTNTGDPVVNKQFFRSWLTLATGSEKLLATYTKEHEVNQYNGIPFLGDIPILKYLAGAASDSKSRTRIFITVYATPVVPQTDLSEWAGRVVSTAEMVKNDEIDK